MRSLTAITIVAACVAGWLYANERDYRDAGARGDSTGSYRWQQAHARTGGETA